MLVFVHVAHRHQGAVLRFKSGVVVGHCLHALGAALFGENLAELRVAGERKRHVTDPVRQFVAGVGAFEVWRAVDVVSGIHQPMGVGYDNGVDAELPAAATDFPVSVDGRFAAVFVRAIEFR